MLRYIDKISASILYPIQRAGHEMSEERNHLDDPFNVTVSTLISDLMASVEA